MLLVRYQYKKTPGQMAGGFLYNLLVKLFVVAEQG